MRHRLKASEASPTALWPINPELGGTGVGTNPEHKTKRDMIWWALEDIPCDCYSPSAVVGLVKSVFAVTVSESYVRQLRAEMKRTMGWYSAGR